MVGIADMPEIQGNSGADACELTTTETAEDPRDAVGSAARDAAWQRQWRVMARLSEQLAGVTDADLPSFAQTAADAIRAELAGACTVLLLDVAEQSPVLYAVSHGDAARRAQVSSLIESMSEETIRRWVNDSARESPRARGRLGGAELATDYGRALRAHADDLGIVSVAFAPLRRTDGRLCGLVTCANDAGAGEMTSGELDILMGAANTTGLLIDVALSRASERVAHRYWASAFEDAPIGKIVLDADRHYVRMNSKACEILGVTSRSMLGRQWPALSEDADRREDLTDAEAVRLGLPVPERIRQIRSPGASESRWVQRSLSAVFDGSGQVELFHIQFSDVTPLRVLEQRANLLAEQRRVLLAELVAAERAERARIGQDVHDDSIQLLAAAQLRIQLLYNQLDGHGPPRTTAEAVSELLSTAQRRLRQLLLDLEPPSTMNRPLRRAVEQVAETLFTGSGTDVSVRGHLSEPPEEVAAVLYRAVREALSNVRAHAGASAVLVEFSENATVWQVRVADDGVGVAEVFDAGPGTLGVRGMSSRVRALGGTCTISRGSAGGTEVRLVVPKADAIAGAGS